MHKKPETMGAAAINRFRRFGFRRGGIAIWADLQ